MTERRNVPADELARLAAKYGDDLLGAPPLVTPERFAEKLAQRDAVDQHFARISSTFAAGVGATPALDERSRFLAVISRMRCAPRSGAASRHARPWRRSC
jgi:hypothetical protein